LPSIYTQVILACTEGV